MKFEHDIKQAILLNVSIIMRLFIVQKSWRKDKDNPCPIAYLFRAGQTVKGIFKVTGLPKSTAYRSVTKLGAGGDASRRNYKRRSNLKRLLGS